ncbi:MAG: hypothetical protein K5652_02355 [Bacteroidales bacterium]|nr:hypothetical protein [Bacteroidales bacterium]
MKKFAMILAAGMVSLSVYAGTPESDAMPFAQLDYNPVTIAMGSTTINCASRLPFMKYNYAAGVGYEDYMPQLSGTKYFIVGAQARTGENSGVSLSFLRGTGEEISGLQYTPFEILVNAGFGFKFNPRLAFGFNVKYAKEHLTKSNSNTAVLVDVTSTWSHRGTTISGGVTGIGEALKTATGKFPLPTALDICARQSFELGEDHKLSLTARSDYYFSGSFGGGVGVEYGFAEVAYARAGYHYGGETILPSFASAGLGLCLGHLELDAAYVFASDVLGNSFSLKIGVWF